MQKQSTKQTSIGGTKMVGGKTVSDLFGKNKTSQDEINELRSKPKKVKVKVNKKKINKQPEVKSLKEPTDSKITAKKKRKRISEVDPKEPLAKKMKKSEEKKKKKNLDKIKTKTKTKVKKEKVKQKKKSVKIQDKESKLKKNLSKEVKTKSPSFVYRINLKRIPKNMTRIINNLKKTKEEKNKGNKIRDIEIIESNLIDMLSSDARIQLESIGDIADKLRKDEGKKILTKPMFYAAKDIVEKYKR